MLDCKLRPLLLGLVLVVMLCWQQRRKERPRLNARRKGSSSTQTTAPFSIAVSTMMECSPSSTFSAGQERCLTRASVPVSLLGTSLTPGAERRTKFTNNSDGSSYVADSFEIAGGGECSKWKCLGAGFNIGGISLAHQYLHVFLTLVTCAFGFLVGRQHCKVPSESLTTWFKYCFYM
jgi:hypothetical protein